MDLHILVYWSSAENLYSGGYPQHRENDLKSFLAGKIQGIKIFKKYKFIALGVDGGCIAKKSSFNVQFLHTIHGEIS